MSEDKRLNDRVAGANAESLLKNEAFKGSCDAVRNELVSLWRQSKTTDERERVWQSVGLLEKLITALAVTHDNGKLADVELKQLIAEEERKRRFRII